MTIKRYPPVEGIKKQNQQSSAESDLNLEVIKRSVRDVLSTKFSHDSGFGVGGLQGEGYVEHWESLNKEIDSLNRNALARLEKAVAKISYLGDKVREAEDFLRSSSYRQIESRIKALGPYADLKKQGKDLSNPNNVNLNLDRLDYAYQQAGGGFLDKLLLRLGIAEKESDLFLHHPKDLQVLGHVDLADDKFLHNAETLYDQARNSSEYNEGVRHKDFLKKHNGEYLSAYREIFDILQTAVDFQKSVAVDVYQDIESVLNQGGVFSREAGQLSERSGKIRASLADMGIGGRLQQADSRIRNALDDVIGIEVIEMIASCVTVPPADREAKVLEALRTKVLFNPHFENTEDAVAFLYAMLVSARDSGENITIQGKSYNIWDGDGQNGFLNKLVDQLGAIARRVSDKYDYTSLSAGLVRGAIKRTEDYFTEEERKKAEEKEKKDRKEKERLEKVTSQSQGGTSSNPVKDGEEKEKKGKVDKAEVDEKDKKKNKLEKLLSAFAVANEAGAIRKCKEFFDRSAEGGVDKLLDSLSPEDLQALGGHLFNLSEKLKLQGKEEDREAVRFVLGKVIDFRPDLFDAFKRSKKQDAGKTAKDKTVADVENQSVASEQVKQDLKKSSESETKRLWSELFDMLKEWDGAGVDEAKRLSLAEEIASSCVAIFALVGKEGIKRFRLNSNLKLPQVRIQALQSAAQKLQEKNDEEGYKFINDMIDLMISPKEYLTSPEEYTQKKDEVLDLEQEAKLTSVECWKNLQGQLKDYSEFEDYIDFQSYLNIAKTCKDLLDAEGGDELLKQFTKDIRNVAEVTKYTEILASILNALEKDSAFDASSEEYTNVGKVLVLLKSRTDNVDHSRDAAREGNNTSVDFIKISDTSAEAEQRMEIYAKFALLKSELDYIGIEKITKKEIENVFEYCLELLDEVNDIERPFALENGYNSDDLKKLKDLLFEFKKKIPDLVETDEVYSLNKVIDQVLDLLNTELESRGVEVDKIPLPPQPPKPQGVDTGEFNNAFTYEVGWYCGFCGANNSKSSNFCRQCGKGSSETPNGHWKPEVEKRPNVQEAKRLVMDILEKGDFGDTESEKQEFYSLVRGLIKFFDSKDLFKMNGRQAGVKVFNSDFIVDWMNKNIKLEDQDKQKLLKLAKKFTNQFGSFSRKTLMREAMAMRWFFEWAKKLEEWKEEEVLANPVIERHDEGPKPAKPNLLKRIVKSKIAQRVVELASDGFSRKVTKEKLEEKTDTLNKHKGFLLDNAKNLKAYVQKTNSEFFRLYGEVHKFISGGIWNLDKLKLGLGDLQEDIYKYITQKDKPEDIDEWEGKREDVVLVIRTLSKFSDKYRGDSGDIDKNNLTADINDLIKALSDLNL